MIGCTRKCGNCVSYFPFWGESRGFCMELDKEGYKLDVRASWEACDRWRSVFYAYDDIAARGDSL